MPLMTEMLLDGLQADQADRISSVLKAAIAAFFFDQYKKAELNLEKLQISVDTRISETKDLVRNLLGRFTSSAGNFKEYLSIIPKFEIWVNRCHDAVSLGEIISLFEVQLVLSRRYFIHENAAIQLFAYICERVRISGRNLPGKALPAKLEALFNDSRVAPFLFMDGRPQTSKNCHDGIERWCDPGSVRPVTSHIYDSRNKPTLTEQILKHKGAVTRDMIQQLGGKTLEQQLDEELDFPDPIRIEDSLISAVRSILKRESIDYTNLWHYLKLKVLNEPELEKRLLNAFIKQWAPEDQDEGSVENLVRN